MTRSLGRAIPSPINAQANRIVTVYPLLRKVAAQHRMDAPFAGRGGDGRWIGQDWGTMLSTAEAYGAAMLARGFVRGDAIAILASTSPAWLQIDMGAMSAGVVSAGIYPTEPPAKVEYILRDCKARLLFVDTPEQAAKAMEVVDRCPDLQCVIVGDGVPCPDHPAFVSGDRFLDQGRALAARSPGALDEAARAVGPGDVAMLIYTSGTTGPPKGAMITHGAFCYQIAVTPRPLRMQAGWRRLSFLPLCHVAERVFTYAAMAEGMANHFVPDIEALPAALREIKPEHFIAVPRLYEKLRSGAERWINDQENERRRWLSDALDAALAAGSPAGLPEDKRSAIAEIREAIGFDRISVCVSGGAQCSAEIRNWQAAIGAPAADLYGMTECGLVALNFEPSETVGTVGRPCPHGEVRLGADGEVLIRGPHVFKGYLNQPDKTEEALRDGWFHTGDVGRFDGEGRLVLIDRIKDLIITSGGKNIAPSLLEGAIKASPYVDQALVVGEGRHFVAALIFIDAAAVAQAIAPAAMGTLSVARLADLPETRNLIAEAIERANAGFSRAERVRDFRIVPREIVAADDLFTPTLKIKRPVAHRLFAGLIEDIYAGAPVPAERREKTEPAR